MRLPCQNCTRVGNQPDLDAYEKLREYIEKNENKRKEKTETAYEKYSAIERRKRHAREQRFNICRIVDLNWQPKTKFLTLTFQENITDAKLAHLEFRKFLKRLNRKINKTEKAKLQYLAVAERQKRGAIHFHVVLFNMPYMPAKELSAIWGNGFIRINAVKVDSSYNCGLYVSKYFEKELTEGAFKEKRMFKSQNLKAPTVKRTMTAVFPEFDPNEILYQNEYKRHVPAHLINPKKEGWETSKVRYYKIKKKEGIDYDFTKNY